MFKKFYILNCYKDNVIHNTYSLANLGKSFILPLVKNNEGVGISNEYSRILLDFNIDNLIDFFGVDSLTSNSFTATLKLYQIKTDGNYHNQNFNIDIFSLTSNWTEGYNYEYDFSASGYSNWNSNALGSTWSTSGGDYVHSISGTQLLESGYEDISIDVTSYIDNYINAKYGLSGLAQYISSTADLRGLLIKYSDYNETLTAFSESKIFYSSHTHTLFNPKIYVEVGSTNLYDNRNNFILGKEQILYFPYRIDGELQNVDSSDIIFSILKDDVPLTSVTSSLSTIQSGIIKSTTTIPATEYSLTSTYKDVWSISGANSITGQFKVYTESDYVGIDYFSLTGNFNKNYVSKSLLNNIGVVAKFNKKMIYDSIEIINFNSFIKKQDSVNNIGFLFNNDLIYPQEFYVKIIDAYSNYEWTNWLRLDLIGDSYRLELDTSSFKIGSTFTFLYKIKSWDTYSIIKANSFDIIEIIKE